MSVRGSEATGGVSHHHHHHHHSYHHVPLTGRAPHQDRILRNLSQRSQRHHGFAAFQKAEDRVGVLEGLAVGATEEIRLSDVVGESLYEHCISLYNLPGNISGVLSSLHCRLMNLVQEDGLIDLPIL